jgi:hypothetical protein
MNNGMENTMTSQRSLPLNVGGLFAVALFAGAPLTSAYAIENSARDNDDVLGLAQGFDRRRPRRRAAGESLPGGAR